MKALDKYFLMVVFTLLQNRVHVFANFMFNFGQRNNGNERIKTLSLQKQTVALQGEKSTYELVYSGMLVASFRC